MQHIRDWLLLRMRSPTSDDDDDDSHGSKAQVETEETKLGNELGHKYHGPEWDGKKESYTEWRSPLEYLLLNTLRSNPAAAMQRGAGDGPIATPGRLGGQVKSSGSAPASGAQIRRMRMNFLYVVVNFHTCDLNEPSRPLRTSWVRSK